MWQLLHWLHRYYSNIENLSVALYEKSFTCLWSLNFLFIYELLSTPFCANLGLVGDSNTLCHDPSVVLSGPSTVGAIGSVCNTGLNCLYGSCVKNICVAPPLLCPTVVHGKLFFSFCVTYASDAWMLSRKGCVILLELHYTDNGPATWIAIYVWHLYLHAF